jgi:hypothetical protein
MLRLLHDHSDAPAVAVSDTARAAVHVWVASHIAQPKWPTKRATERTKKVKHRNATSRGSLDLHLRLVIEVHPPHSGLALPPTQRILPDEARLAEKFVNKG